MDSGWLMLSSTVFSYLVWLSPDLIDLFTVTSGISVKLHMRLKLYGYQLLMLS
ncbi:hypothetical protein SAMN05877838_2498 [Hoeflea halophila]|uniref:Uncharacterized protein n=1 Tax=Hoeflea halophila TaxID=714899 RepID=A0A286IC53_9HYPH|nr:hypothetical protein SAMN05877838_2498 [Hoeflea halophila]